MNEANSVHTIYQLWTRFLSWKLYQLISWV